MNAKKQCDKAGAEYLGQFQNDYLAGCFDWFHMARTNEKAVAIALEFLGWRNGGQYATPKGDIYFTLSRRIE